MNRILIIRTDRFGEFILNLPVIRALRQRYPSSYISVMVSPVVKELIALSRDIDDIMLYDERSMGGLLSGLRLSGQIRKERFDAAIILNPRKIFNIAVFLAGIPVRVGYDRKWGFLLTHKIKDRKHLGEKHEVEYNLDLLAAIGIEPSDKSPRIDTDKNDEEYIKSLLADSGISDRDMLIALHPWTSDPVKQWPVENFAYLAGVLPDILRCRVLVIGGKEEAEATEIFCQGPGQPVNLAGKLSLRQLAALLKTCKLLISNDSGPVHMAAAVGTPVVAVFRNDIQGKSARRWGPWGVKHAVIESGSLSSISPQSVIDAAVNLLSS
ncbi:MAG: glycosyltransferase family 9 protein [Candidatus Omnitrophica bacterium]|nr:glycosyltransferase family 9 protein [Candidatus Omnitrophota bacterium]